MHSIEEKRVYGDREGAITAYVASAIGVVRVRVAGDTVGEFGLHERCDARDVAASGDAVAVATDEDVRMLDFGAGNDAPGDGPFVETGFGPAVAVGSDGETLLAADAEGRVARLDAESDDWTVLSGGPVGPVRAIDGGLVGAEDGVYRVRNGTLEHAGLTDVRDVAAAGVPLAATADGLYALGNGWMETLEGSFETVAADPRARQEPARAHAVSQGTVHARRADGTWYEYDRSSDAVVGIGYGETTYAVTEDGEFRSATPDAAEPWRSRTLGVGTVRAVAVPPSE
jgi:hypothetical protein